MFESDDFDQVLSQFDFPEVATEKSAVKVNKDTGPFERQVKNAHPHEHEEIPLLIASVQSDIFSNKRIETDNNSCLNDAENCEQNANEKILKLDTIVSPKHTKRKIIDSYFNHQSKRKFPGPAGLLTGALEEPKDESIYKIELLSQDIDCNQHSLRKEVFETPIWSRLLSDSCSWNLHDIDSIKTIKQQALSGNLRRSKAQTVTVFVEAVDRSAIDPLIIVRDSTGNIKCTLHRDAWSTFSPYLVSEFCALILIKPTVLTRGGAFKKHYLNITLSNILAIYSSSVLKDENKTLPSDYNIVYEEEFTVIKADRPSNSIETLEKSNAAEDLFNDLDSFFHDDLF